MHDQGVNRAEKSVISQAGSKGDPEESVVLTFGVGFPQNIPHSFSQAHKNRNGDSSGF